MNYYPNNYYQNYPYNNMYQQSQNQMTVNNLQGKVVDSLDMVKANEVPFGGFGVFPKGDLSEIYVKSWNNNGTTQINTYRPIPKEETQENVSADINNNLLEKITMLNDKIDLLINSNNASAKTSIKTEKEVSKINAY